MEERIQKVLSHAGLASRRTVEQWIVAGRVEVNGVKASLGMGIDPKVDHITIDGRPVSSGEVQKRYVLMNKPAGYTTTLKDRHAQHLVSDLLPSNWGRLYPVGRLDRETAGLLLLTNDGTLAHRLMHPSFQVPKVYEAWVRGRPGTTHLERLRDGIPLDEGMAHAHNLQVVKREADRTLVRLTLTEGMKREVRRIFQVIGHPVLELTRTKYGPLSIEGLEPGRFRPLTHAEVKALQQASRPLEEHPINSRRRAIGDERSSRPHYTGRLSLSPPRSRHSFRDTRGDSGRTHR